MAEIPEELPDLLAWQREHMQRVFAAREQACEAAIQTGVCGILEEHDGRGGVTFTVTLEVPYGRVYIKDAF